MADRVEFSKKTRGLAFIRCGGKCEKCEMKLKVSEGEYDHVIPYFISRDSSLDNCQVLCQKCHRGVGAKTADDQRTISKIKRIQMKNNGTWKSTGPKLQSRGFQKRDAQ
jgi:5-methylcytosine-specific restriction protein A